MKQITTTDRHLPLRMNHVVVFGDFTPLQKRRIALAFNGQPNNKLQAAAEGVSANAIQHTWDSVADALRLPWGHRTRQHTMAELCRRHLVEFLCILFVLLPALIAANGSGIDLLRPRRGGRRTRFNGHAALDIDALNDMGDLSTGIVNTPKSVHGGQNTMSELTIAASCTPIKSIAIGATTGLALYIAMSWPGAGHFGTELAAEIAGCATGLLIHRRTSY